jgi:hypothetical protein
LITPFRPFHAISFSLLSPLFDAIFSVSSRCHYAAIIFAILIRRHIFIDPFTISDTFFFSAGHFHPPRLFLEAIFSLNSHVFSSFLPCLNILAFSFSSASGLDTGDRGFLPRYAFQFY